MIRSRSVHRCILCRFRWDLCVCDTTPRLVLNTKVAVVMHAKEWRRSSNTGHFARFVLPGSKVLMHGAPGERINVDQIAPKGTNPYILFPGHGAKPLTPDFVANIARPVCLILPDGSWGQANQMLKRLPGFAAMPKVCLPHLAPAVERMRRNLSPDRMSTFEALIQAIALLEGEEAASKMQAFYARVHARMLFLRGRVPYEAVLAADTTAVYS